MKLLPQGLKKTLVSFRGALFFSAGLMAALTLGACSKSSDSQQPAAPAGVTPRDAVGVPPVDAVDGKEVDQNANQPVGPYRAIGLAAFNKLVSEGVLKASSTQEAKDYLLGLPANQRTSKSLDGAAAAAASSVDSKLSERSLLLSFPLNLLGEQNVFGGVITTLSDRESEAWGMLKLMDITPIHVRPLVGGAGTDKPGFRLVGCMQECSERSETFAFIDIPILAVNKTEASVIIDIADLGQKLDMLAILDRGGRYTELDTVGSFATQVDYSLSSLVFDITTDMRTRPKPGENARQVTFATRWYLKLASAFNPSFDSREETEGVGYFMTERSAKSKITRFAVDQESDTGSIHYFIKTVPAEHKASFKAAFDEWNEVFVKTVGRSLLTYEFVDEDDPRAPNIVAGDVRYNIIEWDLVNRAPYGGLGPSIANQFTGEIMSANVLVQGPFIELIYKKWFETAAQAEELRAQGLGDQADRLMADFQKSARASEPKANRVKLTLGSLSFRTPADMVEYQDPLPRMDFDQLPAGYDYAKYMLGYFQELVAHELGHNFGLRHNFRGNLGAKDDLGVGGQSRSVMEYLGRPFRFKDRIGEYDGMAISYGYLGEEPKARDWFCTDQDQPTLKEKTNSAECTNGDATNDPYSYFEKYLEQATSYLVNRGSKAAPNWQVSEMRGELSKSLLGLAYYKSSAASSASSWTNFFGKAGRPAPDEVGTYVVNSIRQRLCDPALLTEANNKESQEGKDKAIQNLSDLQTFAKTLLVANKVLTLEEVACP
jgi:hypothetical protein